MGRAKAEMMRHEDLVGTAAGVLIKAKAIEACAVHDDIMISLDDPEATSRAYAIGTAMVKDGNVDATREEFMDAIKEALEQAGDECGICANNRDRD